MGDNGLSEWSDWSVACLEVVKQGCVRLRQRVCLGEDLKLCPGVDQYGVQDEFFKCPENFCKSMSVFYKYTLL